MFEHLPEVGHLVDLVGVGKHVLEVAVGQRLVVQAGFNLEFIAYGGCFGINRFDDIRPAGTAVRSHGFVDPGTGQPYADIAAGVVFDRLVNIDRKVDISFPFGDLYVQDSINRALPGVSSRTLLLEEILTYLDPAFVSNDGDATAAPTARAAAFDLFPNPFNPKTTFSFTLPRQNVKASVKVFNVRGELVKTVFDDISTGNTLNLEWNGQDNSGRNVASGVYLVKAVTENFSATKKAVLVK